LAKFDYNFNEGIIITKPIYVIIAVAVLLVGCDAAKESGDKTARELTGNNMLQQEQQLKNKINDIKQQQKDRYKKLDQQ